MVILEMLRSDELQPAYFFTVIQSIALSILCWLLARSKDRCQVAALVTGLIPVLNYLAVLYYVGVPKQEARDVVNAEGS